MEQDKGTSPDTGEMSPSPPLRTGHRPADDPLDDDVSVPVRRQRARDPVKFGFGIFIAFLAAAFALAAVVFVWFGFFPGLVMATICAPLSMLAAHLIHKGRPYNST